MRNDILIRVEGVSKKFCSRLKKSLWYGVEDTIADLFGRSNYELLRTDEFWALDDVSFELRPGECLGLIGQNGAGKTTLLKMLNGLIKPDRGRIEMHGRVGALIALGAGFNPILSGRENIYVAGAVIGLSKRDVDRKLDEIVSFAEIGEFIDMPVQSYSSGMQTRLGFSIATALEPEILLVDEVLAVGDVRFRMRCYKKILNSIDKGTTIIFVSHNKLDLERVCTTGLILSKGRICYSGNILDALSEYDRMSMMIDGSESQSLRFVEPHQGSTPLKGPLRLRTGEELDFTVRLVSKVSVPDARILWHLDAPGYGRLSSLSTTHNKIKFNLAAGTTDISIKIPRVPLINGVYKFCFDVYGPDIDSFIGASPAYEINVIGPARDPFGFGAYGVLDVGLEWEVGTSPRKDHTPSAASLSDLMPTKTSERTKPECKERSEDSGRHRK